MSESISLNKYISSQGHCSRREADRLIEAGRVQINKVVAKKGNRVEPGDEVILDGRIISTPPQSKKKGKAKKHVYLVFNKPKGVVTTTDLREPANIISFINYPKRIFPIGRLDKDSEGLLLLTDDGDIVNRILRSNYDHEKEYIVSVKKSMTNEFLEGLASPMSILGKKLKPVKVSRVNDNTFKIILTQGLNRQIRRMCLKLDYKVKSLKRVRLMNIHLRELPVGKWRHINEQELRSLKDSLDYSS